MFVFWTQHRSTVRIPLTPTSKKNLAALLDVLSQGAGSQVLLSKELKIARGGINEFANGKRDSTGLTLLPALVEYLNREYVEIAIDQLVQWLEQKHKAPHKAATQLLSGSVPAHVESDRKAVSNVIEKIVRFALSQIDDDRDRQTLLKGLVSDFSNDSDREENTEKLSLSNILKGAIPSGWQTPHQMWRELIPVLSAETPTKSEGAIARIIEDGDEKAGLIVTFSPPELKARLVSGTGLSKNFSLAIDDRKEHPYPGQKEFEVSLEVSDEKPVQIQVKLKKVFTFPFSP